MVSYYDDGILFTVFFDFGFLCFLSQLICENYLINFLSVI